MTAPGAVMIFAAGLGSRMGALTRDRPKPLIEVAGQPLIAHALALVRAAGIARVVVNIHAHAPLMRDWLAANAPEVAVSEETVLLETGGGLKKARPLLGDDPVFVANIDSVWIDRGDALGDLVRLWDPERMDVVLLLARREGSIGFEGDGDVFCDTDGRLTFRGDAPSAPYAYMGVHITRPDYADEGPVGPFSLSSLWRKSAEAGRLFGCVLDGEWMHVGDPQARDEAEARLAESE